jgi:U3 small nucleolar ribonucleoprotein protein IMP4
VVLYITSSRRPSVRTRIFIKELERVIPGSKRLVRGKKSLDDILKLMVAEGASHIFVIDNVKGNPSNIRIYELYPGQPKMIARLFISGLSLQVDVKKKRYISQLEIVDRCNNKDSTSLFDLLRRVIPETRFSVTEKGVPGKLVIECDKYLLLKFLDDRDRVLYPVIRVSRVDYERSI